MIKINKHRNLTIKTSAAILATAKLPWCIHFIHTAKSRGKCCRQSCWLDLQSHTHLIPYVPYMSRVKTSNLICLWQRPETSCISYSLKPVSWKQSTIQKATHVDLLVKTGKKMRLNWIVKYHRTVEINGISQKEKSSWMTIKRYLIFLYNSTAGTPLNKQWKGSNQVNQAGMKN